MLELITIPLPPSYQEMERAYEDRGFLRLALLSILERHPQMISIQYCGRRKHE